MYLLLSEPLPLRTTRMLGDFADDRVLPHRLGDMRASRFELVKLTDSEWFAADHAMTVTDVQIDDESVAGWDQQLRTDGAGNTWTVVRLAAAAPRDSSVTASGTGRLDDRTGRLIENPADVMEYVLRLAGRAEIFPQLRAEAAAESLTLAGSLDALKSIRSWLDEIAYSCGAIWTTEAARLYPTSTVVGPVAEFYPETAEKVVVESDVDDTCDVLRVSYDIDGSTDRAAHYIELSARPLRYGGVSKEVTLKWLRTPANAETVGRRMLQRMAGELYAVALTSDQTTIRPCQWARLNNHPQWPIDATSPVGMVLATDVAPDQNSTEVVLEVVASTPTVAVTAHSLAVPRGTSSALDVVYSNGVATFTITDENGQPIRDAFVSLDGGQAKRTDQQGRVSFEATPGAHVIAVDAAGYEPFQLGITL